MRASLAVSDEPPDEPESEPKVLEPADGAVREGAENAGSDEKPGNAGAEQPPMGGRGGKRPR